MKRKFKIIILGLILAVFLTIIGSILKSSDDIFFKNCLCIMIGIIVISTIINIIYNFYYIKKVNKLIPKLDSSDIEEFISNIESLLLKAKGKNLKVVLNLNLAVGYSEIENYEKSIEIMESINEEELKGMLLNVYKVNSCIYYFFAKRYEKAMFLYKDNKELFFKVEKKSSVQLANAIKSLHIFYAIMSNNFSEARERIDDFSKRDLSNRSRKKLPYFDKLLLEREKEINL